MQDFSDPLLQRRRLFGTSGDRFTIRNLQRSEEGVNAEFLKQFTFFCDSQDADNFMHFIGDTELQQRPLQHGTGGADKQH